MECALITQYIWKWVNCASPQKTGVFHGQRQRTHDTRPTEHSVFFRLDEGSQLSLSHSLPLPPSLSLCKCCQLHSSSFPRDGACANAPVTDINADKLGEPTYIRLAGHRTLSLSLSLSLSLARRVKSVCCSFRVLARYVLVFSTARLSGLDVLIQLFLRFIVSGQPSSGVRDFSRCRGFPKGAFLNLYWNDLAFHYHTPIGVTSGVRLVT